jgi:hypothetical protein
MVKLRIPSEITTAINVAFGFLPVSLQQLTGVVEAQRASCREGKERYAWKSRTTALALMSAPLEIVDIAAKAWAYSPCRNVLNFWVGV